MHVDESRRDDAAGAVERPAGRLAGEFADGGDPLAGNRYIGRDPRLARAVDDRAAVKQEIEHEKVGIPSISNELDAIAIRQCAIEFAGQAGVDGRAPEIGRT
jgi:hypothetical protein